ncbi:MAG: hypothetical protein WBX11_12220 [Thiobacillaceae bacterium]|jgi:hypothetical protein
MQQSALTRLCTPVSEGMMKSASLVIMAEMMAASIRDSMTAGDRAAGKPKSNA